MLSQKKETKEKATPLPLYPSVLAPHMGRLRNSRFLRSNSLAVYQLLAQASGAARVLKTIRNFTAVSLYLHRHSVLDTESSDFLYLMTLDSDFRRNDGGEGFLRTSVSLW